MILEWDDFGVGWEICKTEELLGNRFQGLTDQLYSLLSKT